MRRSRWRGRISARVSPRDWRCTMPIRYRRSTFAGRHRHRSNAAPHRTAKPNESTSLRENAGNVRRVRMRRSRRPARRRSPSRLRTHRPVWRVGSSRNSTLGATVGNVEIFGDALLDNLTLYWITETIGILDAALLRIQTLAATVRCERLRAGSDLRLCLTGRSRATAARVGRAIVQRRALRRGRARRSFPGARDSADILCRVASRIS